MTLSRDEIMAMSAEELRVAIAKKKGMDDLRWLGTWENNDGNYHFHKAPDYPHDIAAAWELEDSLPERERPHYEYLLLEIVGGLQQGYWWNLSHATAEQRSRAWLIWSEESGE